MKSSLFCFVSVAVMLRVATALIMPMISNKIFRAFERYRTLCFLPKFKTFAARLKSGAFCCFEAYFSIEAVCVFEALIFLYISSENFFSLV